MVADRFVVIPEVEPVSAVAWSSRFIQRYSDNRRVDLADATLVYLAQQLGLRRILTLDQRDFATYRLDDNSPLEMVVPNHAD